MTLLLGVKFEFSYFQAKKKSHWKKKVSNKFNKILICIQILIGIWMIMCFSIYDGYIEKIIILIGYGKKKDILKFKTKEKRYFCIIGWKWVKGGKVLFFNH